MFNQQVTRIIEKIVDNSRKIDQVTKVEADMRSYQHIRLPKLVVQERSFGLNGSNVIRSSQI